MSAHGHWRVWRSIYTYWNKERDFKRTISKEQLVGGVTFTFEIVVNKGKVVCGINFTPGANYHTTGTQLLVQSQFEIQNNPK